MLDWVGCGVHIKCVSVFMSVVKIEARKGHFHTHKHHESEAVDKRGLIANSGSSLDWAHLTIF